ncbi:MAG: enoyl-CoA hydratase-related protein [Acidobacteriota bacterium]
MSNLITDRKEGGLAVLTVNRPEKLNALNGETMREIEEAFAAFKADGAVKAVIVTGAGEKAFIAGADIAELAKQTPVEGKEYALRGQRTFDAIENLGKPVIAAINGFALGGGMELAMACTLRVASENAQLGQPEVLLGIIPGYAGTQRLPRLVGKGRALEIILTGDRISAQEAHRIGLVNRVVPQADLLAESEKLARIIMSRGPLAVRYAMEAVQTGMDGSFEDGCFVEASLFALLTTTSDMKEGTAAFLEKRKASFSGT